MGAAGNFSCKELPSVSQELDDREESDIENDKLTNPTF